MPFAKTRQNSSKVTSDIRQVNSIPNAEAENHLDLQPFYFMS